MKHLMPRIYVVESKGLKYPDKICLVLGVTGAVGILALSAAEMKCLISIKHEEGLI
ncbi:hypothetical protein Anas_07609 [Armadillidium nasatum]|uniref:Uncharacterized protein n=1 Tax=Armadillidium nasatum TaxID=96803 RepID=A0A5N5TFJ1_9CRUS|nr:hypothetical protein Anas_07609 [Armadillidium nasatum]